MVAGYLTIQKTPRASEARGHREWVRQSGFAQYALNGARATSLRHIGAEPHYGVLCFGAVVGEGLLLMDLPTGLRRSTVRQIHRMGRSGT